MPLSLTTKNAKVNLAGVDLIGFSIAPHVDTISPCDFDSMRNNRKWSSQQQMSNGLRNDSRRDSNLVGSLKERDRPIRKNSDCHLHNVLATDSLH